ncbi:MAG: HK97 family phage prohead protease [Gemmataceae bacterium]
MMRRIHHTPRAATLQIDRATRTVRSVISTIDPDRSGDIVVPTGLRNADEFRLNPVVLWAHQHTRFPPIGQCDWLDVQPYRIVAQTRFTHQTIFAEDIFNLYAEGVLRGWSIGFVPRKAINQPTGGRRFVEWDLLEYSAVAVPENPQALTLALEQGLVRDARLRQWLERDILAPLVQSA